MMYEKAVDALVDAGLLYQAEQRARDVRQDKYKPDRANLQVSVVDNWRPSQAH